MKKITLLLLLFFICHGVAFANEIKLDSEISEKLKASFIKHDSNRYGFTNIYKNKKGAFLNIDSNKNIILKSPFRYNDSVIISLGVSFGIESSPSEGYFFEVNNLNIFLESVFNNKSNINLYYGLNKPIGDKISNNFDVGAGGVYDIYPNIFGCNDKDISPYKLTANTLLSDILQRKFKVLKYIGRHEVYYDADNNIRTHNYGVFQPLSLGISSELNTENNFNINYNILYINNMYVDSSNDYTINNNKIKVIKDAMLDKKVINYYKYAIEGGVGVAFELQEDQILSLYIGGEYTAKPSSFYFDKNTNKYESSDNIYNRMSGALFNSEYTNGNEDEGSYSLLFSYYLSLNHGEPKKVNIIDINGNSFDTDIDDHYNMYYYTIGIKKTDFLGSVSLSYMYSKQNLIAKKRNNEFNRFFAISLDGEFDVMAALGIGKKCNNEVCDYILNFKPYAGITYVNGSNIRNDQQEQLIFNLGIKASF